MHGGGGRVIFFYPKREVLKILKINEINGYKVSCLFNNGESRIINFKVFFKNLRAFSKKHPAYKLVKDKTAFDQIEVLGNTIGWKNTGIHSTDLTGKKVFYPYDLDPIVLFEASKMDKNRSIVLGLFIKQARKEAGFSRKKLAQKSGVKKAFITKLEKNKLDISLATIKKIIEVGLGKKMRVEIS